MQFIDLKKQYELLQGDIQGRIEKVLNHGIYIMGPEVQELEEQLAQYVQAKHCITLASGTDALMIAMMALGIKPGDEIITTPFTFIATAETIRLLGALPVFVDIDPKTYNIDPARIEEAITAKTKLIMPVNLYGQCADYDAINKIAAKHNIPVVEDAAQSFGAIYKNRYSCNLGSIGCASFFPAKPLGCYGDGGACFTNDDELADMMRMIRNHGQITRYNHVVIGVNSRLDSIQAAILLSKLSVFEAEAIMRQEAAQLYHKYLSDFIETPFVESFNRSIFAQYTIQVDDRSDVQDALQKLGIPTAVHYPVPLHKQPVFQDGGCRSHDVTISEHLSHRVMSLPFHPYLQETDIKRIASAVVEIVSSKSVPA